VLARVGLAVGKPRYRGGVARSATQWHTLCRGNLDRMTTDTKGLLVEGMRLAMETFEAAQDELGWQVEDFNEFVIHQVSRVHTQAIVDALGLDHGKVMTVFAERGNIGPASLPIVLSKLRDAGRLEPGNKVALFGIGSGLNCAIAQVWW
jgi:3-oxoacyl-[acyl-carrier-protein] synthase III